MGTKEVAGSKTASTIGFSQYVAVLRRALTQTILSTCRNIVYVLSVCEANYCRENNRCGPHREGATRACSGCNSYAQKIMAKLIVKMKSCCGINGLWGTQWVLLWVVCASVTAKRGLRQESVTRKDKTADGPSIMLESARFLMDHEKFLPDVIRPLSGLLVGPNLRPRLSRL